MNWIRNKQQWRDYLLITLGTAVMAVATSSIYDPAGLVTGGFSGLAIVIKQLSQMLFGKGVPLWVTNLVLNIPLFLFGIRMSRDFLVKTIFGTLMNTFWIAVLPVLQLVPDDRMLSALFGGVLMGAGIGLVFIGNGTTGGTDMMAALIQRKLRHYSVAQVMQVLDGIIVIAGIFVFGIHASLYAIVAIEAPLQLGVGGVIGREVRTECRRYADGRRAAYTERANGLPYVLSVGEAQVFDLVRQERLVNDDKGVPLVREPDSVYLQRVQKYHSQL